MQILSPGRWRVGLARHQPGGSVIGVSVSFAITRHHIQQNGKLLSEEEILKARETASDSGKHSAAKSKEERDLE